MKTNINKKSILRQPCAQLQALTDFSLLAEFI